jgi:signal transduction histidine kinase
VCQRDKLFRERLKPLGREMPNGRTTRNRFMGETKSATSGRSQTTAHGKRGRASRIALAGLLAGLLGVVLWCEWAILQRVAELESAWDLAIRDHRAGARGLQDGVSRMNEAMFRFQLTEAAEDREQFQQASRRFAEEFAEARTTLRANPEAAEISAVEQAFDNYLAEMAQLTEKGVRALRRDTPGQMLQVLREKSRDLETAVGRMTDLVAATVDGLQDRRREDLAWLRRLLVGSGLAMLAFLGVAGFQIFRGITAPSQAELSQAQAASVRQERLASLGVLAAGVAHEIRNPLTALKFRLFSLKKALPAGLANHPDLGILGQEINRLERIVQDFLEFARPSDPIFARVNAAELIAEVHELLRVDLDRGGIAVRVDAAPAIEVRVDRHQLKQVLINLIRNAAESMNGGGVLTLSVREGAANWLRRTQAVVLIEVTDTGKGIPAEVEPRIFDPFHSTKDGGSGLGLSIAARIVELHGGHIQYATRPGQGTTFTVVLPKRTSDEREDSADRR